MTTLPPPQRLETIVLDLLELQSRANRGWSHTQEIGVHYVIVSARVVDAQPVHLDLALDLLNVPREDEEDSLIELGERRNYVAKFAEMVPKGTRAECRKFLHFVQRQLQNTERTR